VVAHYDGVAAWYDRKFADSELGASARRIVLRLLGPGPGRVLDIGCGGGLLLAELAEAGWTAEGVDVSEEQLELARRRGAAVQLADGTELPFPEESFDAVVSVFTHTDVEDFGRLVGEAARVLRPGGPFVYLGVHPCFVGPHAFVFGLDIPQLHPGYRETGRQTEAPGISSEGLRARVGASHLPLGLFLETFLEQGLLLERFEEPQGRDYPHVVALRWRH
jgi:SAM-dependent methyltransferase